MVSTTNEYYDNYKKIENYIIGQLVHKYTSEEFKIKTINYIIEFGEDSWIFYFTGGKLFEINIQRENFIIDILKENSQKLEKLKMIFDFFKL